MPWLLTNVRDAVGNSMYRVYKATIPVQHRVAAVLTWPWRRSSTRYIIYRHITYTVTIECVPAWLICARCNQVPTVPKKTDCDRTVCRKCLGYNNQCPLCNNTNCVASRSLEYAQQISKLKAKCPTPQCKWYGRVEEVTEHLQKCGDVTVACPQCGTEVLRKHQFKHKDCCPLQIKNCLYCRKKGIAKDIIVHEETECSLRKVECPNLCGDLDIFHDKLEIHLQEHCPLRPVLCKRCNKEYVAEEHEQHHCVPPRTQSSHDLQTGQYHMKGSSQSTAQTTQHTASTKNSSHSTAETTQETDPVRSRLPSEDYPDVESDPPQPEVTSEPSLENMPSFPVKIPIADYTTYDNSKSKAEVLQRIVISYITLCLLSTVAYLRNQRVTDVEFEYDMEIPSVLLWSVLTSSLVYLGVLNGSSCYRNLFKAINAKECIVIALAINFIHLIRFYPNNFFPIILGSLCGSVFEVFLFHKYVTRFPGQFTNTVWVMTQFIAIVLAPFIIIYYNNISNLRAAIMQLVYVIYIVVLREKRRLEACWSNMTQENRTVGIYLVNGIVLFSVTLYSVTAISYELFSTSCSSLKILLIAVLPVAYFYLMAKEEVQDVMLEFGVKLYKSSMYSFWGRLCMVSIFYYTMTICFIIPIVQETGDFIVGSALASVLIVYSIIVQTGLFSKDGAEQILKDSTDTLDNPIQWRDIPLTDIEHNCRAMLKVRFVETIDIHDNANPNATKLTVLAELEKINNDTLVKETTNKDLFYSLSLSVTNKEWTSCNETINFSSRHIFGPMLKNNMLGSAFLELSKWERYIDNDKSITLNIQLNY